MKHEEFEKAYNQDVEENLKMVMKAAGIEIPQLITKNSWIGFFSEKELEKNEQGSFVIHENKESYGVELPARNDDFYFFMAPQMHCKYECQIENVQQEGDEIIITAGIISEFITPVTINEFLENETLMLPVKEELLALRDLLMNGEG